MCVILDNLFYDLFLFPFWFECNWARSERWSVWGKVGWLRKKFVLRQPNRALTIKLVQLYFSACMPALIEPFWRLELYSLSLSPLKLIDGSGLGRHTSECEQSFSTGTTQQTQNVPLMSAYGSRLIIFCEPNNNVLGMFYAGSYFVTKN